MGLFKNIFSNASLTNPYDYKKRNMNKKIILSLIYLSIVVTGMGETKLISIDEKGYRGTKNREAIVFYNRGSEAMYQQNPEAGIVSLKKAVELEPKYVEAWDNLGVCYRRVGDYANAEMCYNRSLEVYPNGAMAHMNLALVYQNENKYENAKKEYAIIKEIEPDNPESYFGLASICVQKGELDQGIINAKEALKRYKAKNDPNCIDAEKLLTQIYAKKGNQTLLEYWSREIAADKSKYNLQ